MSQYINVRKLFKGGNYMRKYGILLFSVGILSEEMIAVEIF